MANFQLVKSKKELALLLSKVEGFHNPKLELEQYITPSEIAAELLWYAYINGHILDKTIVDVGAGTGILGIGALLLGARFVYFVEKDRDAIDILERNLHKFEIPKEKYAVINADFMSFDQKTDVIISNPPFGRQSKEGRKFLRFLRKKPSRDIYLIWEEARFNLLQRLVPEYSFLILAQVKFPIKASFEFHIKKKHFFNALLLQGYLVSEESGFHH